MTRESLILVPGLLCDETVWVHQSANLGDLVDARVTVHEHVDSLPAMAESIVADAPRRFALAGHSMGGRIALEIVRRHPERVKKLALLDTGYTARAPGAAGEQEARGRQALIDKARREGMRAMGRAWVQGMVHPRRLADRDLIERILDMIEAKPFALYAGQIRALLNRPDATALLPTIKCPALVLCGLQDSWSPLEQHERMATLIPDGTLVAVPDCGHMSMMEKPDTVTGALRNWLTGAGWPLPVRQPVA